MTAKITQIFYNKEFSEIYRAVVQTILIFALIILPLSLNIVQQSPPYSITNTSPAGMSYFNSLLIQEGYKTTRTLLTIEPILNFPSGSVVIIAGGTKNYLTSDLLILETFVSQGGVLLLLSGDSSATIVSRYFGIHLSSAVVLETENYYKAPDIVLVPSPIKNNSTLCFVDAKQILVLPTSPIPNTEIGSISTLDTAFVDSNYDSKWTQDTEPTQSIKVGTIIQYGKGIIITISTPNFLTNDLYEKGFGNIDLVMALLGQYTKGKTPLICFEESHKRWPIFSTEGIINQGYGTIMTLTKSSFFVTVIVLLVLLLYLIVPRYKMFVSSKETFQQVLSNRIWSRERELYDTFGVAVKPTVEEKMLSMLYFENEILGRKIYNILLQQKLSSIQKGLLTEEEILLFEDKILSKLTHQEFLQLFKKLDQIEKRRKII